MGEAAVVTVGDGDQFDSGNLDRGACVALALNARADERELDEVVRGARRWGRRLRQKLVQMGRGGCDGCGLCGVLEEGSAIKHGDSISLFALGVSVVAVSIDGKSPERSVSSVDPGHRGTRSFSWFARSALQWRLLCLL